MLKRKRRAFARMISLKKRDVEFVVQRVNRGWDDSSIWSLDNHLCHILGQQLEQFSQHDVDLGAAALKHSASLLRYAEKQYDLMFFFPEEFAVLHKDAEKALRWVGKNLPALWT